MLYAVTGEPIPPEFTTAAGINRLLATITELRAILAPFLDEPFCVEDAGRPVCLFCDMPKIDGHREDCCALRADRLLGRAPDEGG